MGALARRRSIVAAIARPRAPHAASHIAPATPNECANGLPQVHLAPMRLSTAIRTGLPISALKGILA
jgi:hypothetical protein